MQREMPYDTDLAYIHDHGYGEFARGAAPWLIQTMRQAGIHNGLVTDLGCGSGIWGEALVQAGYSVVGVDISPAMIELAQARVPQGQWHVAPLAQFAIPPCRAVTALGEVFNYLFDGDHSLATLRTVAQSAYDALLPGGLMIFDVATPDRCRGRTHAFTEGDDWACIVEYQHDEPRRQLARRIVTFRRIGEGYRRHVETHRQQLLEPDEVDSVLNGAGFTVRRVPGYGDHVMFDGVMGFVAAKA